MREPAVLSQLAAGHVEASHSPPATAGQSGSSTHWQAEYQTYLDFLVMLSASFVYFKRLTNDDAVPLPRAFIDQPRFYILFFVMHLS